MSASGDSPPKLGSSSHSEPWTTAELSIDIQDGNETVKPMPSQADAAADDGAAAGSDPTRGAAAAAFAVAQDSPDEDEESPRIPASRLAGRKPRASSTAGIFDLDADDKDVSAPNTIDVPYASGSQHARQQQNKSVQIQPSSPPASVAKPAFDTLRRGPQPTQRAPFQHVMTSSSSVGMLSIPTPIHSGGTSPASGKHMRAPFDTIPPFSSPLAYATTLPIESPEDIDIDASAANNDQGEEEEARTYDSAITTRSDSSSKTSSPGFEKTPKPSNTRQFPASSTSSPGQERRTFTGRKSLTESTPGKRLAARISAGDSTATALTHVTAPTSGRKSTSSNMGPPLTIPRKSAGQPSSGSSTSSSSARHPEGGEGSSQVRALLSRARSINQGRSASGASEDGAGSARSGSPVSSSGQAAGATSPTTTWGNFSGSPSVESGVRPVPINRTRGSISSATSSNAHRRARSLGGSLLGASEVASSPIGGPDGVDPNLVAAIRAGDADIPGSMAALETTISRSPVNEHHRKSLSTSKAAAARIASLPSTPSGTSRGASGSVQMPLGSDEYPLSEGDTEMNPGPSEDEDEVGDAPMAFVRPRVRSQTMQNMQRGHARLASGPPTAARGAFEARSPARSAEGMLFPTSDQHQHGLGIGMSSQELPAEEGLRIPTNRSHSRAWSPLAFEEAQRMSSPSASAYSSPRALRPADTKANDESEARSEEEKGQEERLSLQIPAFTSHDAHLGPVSALPSINYSPQHSPRIRSRAAPPSAWSQHVSQSPLTPKSSAGLPDEAASTSAVSMSGRDRKRRLTLGPNAGIHSEVRQEEAPQGNPHFSQRISKEAFETPSRSTGRGSSNFSARRLSLVQAPQGVDEYARVIVQSRNAKLQKWRSTNRPQEAPTDLESARDALQRMTLGSPEADAFTTTGPPPAATPNVSPTASPPASRADSPASDAGEREIEWVDWLDEYSRLKEAKLRATRKDIDEMEGEAKKSPETAMGSSSTAQRPAFERARSSEDAANDDSPTSQRSSPMRPQHNHYLFDMDKQRTVSPRRPSQFSGRHQHSLQNARSLSGTIALDGDGAQRKSVGRAPLSSERARHLSMSQSTSRTSGMGVFGATPSASGSVSRRKKLLGGRIEAWWGAVKSGFNPPGSVPGSATVAGHERSDRAKIHAMGSIATPKSSFPQSGTGNELQRGHSIAGPRYYKYPSTSPRERAASHQPDTGLDASTLRTTPSVLDLFTLDGSEAGSKSKDKALDEDAYRSQLQGIPSGNQTVEASVAKEPQGNDAEAVSSQPLDASGDSEHPGDAPDGMMKSSSARSQRRPLPPLSLNLGGASPSPLTSEPNSRCSPMLKSVSAFDNEAASQEGHERDRLSDAWQPVFAKESILRRPRSSSRSHEAESRSASKARDDHLSGGSKDITIESIRRHILHRLASSKESCDRELRRVIKAINAFADEHLLEQRKQDELDATTQALAKLGLEEYGDEQSAPSSAVMSRAGTDGQALGSASSSSPIAQSRSPSRDTQDTYSQDVSPGATTQPTDGDETDLLSVPTPRQPSKGVGEYRLPPPPHRPSTSVSRHLSISGRRERSRDLTSASTSRSHSPMPALSAQSADSPHYSPARRIRPQVNDETPLEPYVVPLQGLVGIAMDLLDTSISTLTMRPGACQEVIGSIQELGKAWEAHPDWPGRGWYVKLLLAVASLSRVVEWWEAEKGFWNFDHETEGGEDGHDREPLRFIVGQQAGNSSAQATNDPRSCDGHSPSTFARHLASSSPVRLVRNPSLWPSSTPSQHSSAANSPALEAIDPISHSQGGQARLEVEEKGEKIDDSIARRDSEPRDSGTHAETPASVKDSQNVLMELSLEGEHFLYLSPAWWSVVGSEPSGLFGLQIADLLAADDANIFAEATKALEVDDSHTVEAVFFLRVEPSVVIDADENAIYYQEMEGKGMLMHDRVNGAPSHTMWVFKPTSPPMKESDVAPGQKRIVTAGADNFGAVPEGADTLAAGKSIILSVEPVLCRICERDVPAWFFEKHSEICNEIHRLEMEITESNENIAELRQTVQDIVMQVDEKQEAVEYNGIEFTTPPAPAEPPSALEGASKSLALRQPNQAAVRKAHIRAFNSILEILRSAGTISTPVTKDNAETIEEQRLLSPDSEGRLSLVREWQLPAILSEDAAFELLSSDVTAVLRRKLSAVNRMLNTIVYVETVRMEWEQRVNTALAEADEDDNEAQNRSPTSSECDTEGEAAGERTIDQESHSAVALNEKAPEPDLDAENSAMLLEHDDADDQGPASTNLSAQDETPENEDVPEVESAMGGSSIIDAIPIPPRSNARVRQMRRDTSAISSSSGEGSAPGQGLLPSNSAAMSRRGSVRGDKSLGLTPPHSPAEFSLGSSSHTRAQERRISNAVRASFGTPLSPRLPPAAPSSRPTVSSIKDFDIIKPISKGAFGSVFLAKKRTTGDYYAIKVLKKSDMIAKNQITNVKAERMILMTQTQSPFVVKLFFTFQSSENLYLVMEYLPGGDCASLVKVLGGLPEDWAKQFLAEVVNGLEMLHKRGVVHRDMKPDNLLIDQKGHLKLTDFGLSKIGLLGRQNHQQQMRGRSSYGGQGQAHAKKDSMASASSLRSSASSTPLSAIPLPPTAPVETPSTAALAAQPFYVGTPTHPRGRIMSTSTDVSDSGRLEGLFPAAPGHSQRSPLGTPTDSPRYHFGSHIQSDVVDAVTGSGGAHGSADSGGQLKRFVGTPDYLAPESILGVGMDDAAVDWWAVGVILYEFLYGYPPFHAETPEKVFDNILSRNIDWESEDLEYSAEARDLMERLICTDRKNRLGVNGAEEIKKHAFFEGIDWANLNAEDGPFVPQITDPESTDYFDLRGAVYQELDQEQTPARGVKEFAEAIAGHARFIKPSRPPTRNRVRSDKHSKQAIEKTDEFGAFSFKNLPVLKQANDEVVKKMRGDQLNSMSSAIMEQQASGAPPQPYTPRTQQPISQASVQQALMHQRHRSVSGMAGVPASHRNSAVLLSQAAPPSPSTSISSMSSVPSKSTAPTSPSGIPLSSVGVVQIGSGQIHRRRQSEWSALSAGATSSPSTSLSGASNSASHMERKRSQLAHSEEAKKASASPRLRASSAAVELAATESPPSGVPWHIQVSAKSSSHVQDGSSSGADSSPAPAHEDLGNVVESKDGAIHGDILACMIAEDNPISQHMLESVLTKLGCRVVCVRNGAEALRLAMGEERYALIFLGTTLPIVNGQDVARMVRSTRNNNAATPIIALARPEEGEGANEGSKDDDPLDAVLRNAGGVFDGILSKPIDRADVCALLPRLGFQALPVSALGFTPQPSASPTEERKESASRRATVSGGETDH